MKPYLHLVFLLLCFNSLLGTPLFQKDSVETIEEEVYLSVRYLGVIDEIVIAYYTGERFYLPLTELFDIFGVNYEFDPSRLSIGGFFLTKGNRYSLDFSSRQATVGSDVFQLDVNNYKIKELDFFLTPEIFKEVFGLELIVDLSRLSIRLITKHQLPIVKRHSQRNKEALRARSNPSSDEQYDLLLDRDPRILDGALFDYSLLSTVSSERQYGNLNLNLGGEILYGDVQGTLITTVNKDTTVLEGTNVRWRYANEIQPWFSTVTLGQQSASGLTNATFQGITVTNQSLIPLRSYDSYSIDGTTDPEAEVELYQDGRLLEVIQADDIGYYRFMVPLNYGTSEFMLRIFGKQGRVIELERRVQIPFHFLPVGDFRYDVSGGRIASESLGWEDQLNTSTGNLSFGMTNWLTGSLGVEYFENSNGDRPIFNTKLSSRVAGDMLVSLDAVLENFYRLSVRGVGPNASSFSLDHTYFDKQDIYNPFGVKQNFNMNLFYPFRMGTMRFTGRSSLRWVNREDNDQLDIKLDVNQFLRGFRFRYGLNEQHNFSPTGHQIASEVILGAVYLIPRLPSFHYLLRGSYFRTDLSINSSMGRAEEVKFQFIKQFSSKLKTQLLTSYDLNQDTYFFEMGLTWDLDAIRSTSTLRSTRSSPSFTQTLRGSAGLDRTNGQVIWDSRQQVGRSGVSIRMFEDENNSGTFDLDEKIIPGNAVTIEQSSSRLVTKSGITRLTQLQPYRRYNFRVNEARINNPILVSSKPKFSVITDPNRIKRIDVPFYTTGIIEGRVYKVRGDEFIPVAGLKIHLRKIDGSYESMLRTFADGSYYSMEVPPGEYEAWVDESQLEFLGVQSTPEKLLFYVLGSSDGDYVEDLNFILE
ncbi:MAG: hypothetical protein H8E26_03070 [FCB group bacterium]|nr:hypothetical protein [FCB group bacterium]MBL7027967.1 hypothetical protein [Candidatus Neomarinimicrobiota bacterium]MBL7122894.1 hypothetical protein [Candidatus Neomarinimicrobiota bacterium]